MSTTTDKPSLLEDLKKQAGEIAEKIKEATQRQLEGLHQKLQEAHTTVQSLTAQIHELSPKPAGAKRGRKAGSKNKTVKAAKTTKPAKAGKKRKGKRGAVGEAISAVVAKAGKKGAHVKDIATALKMDVKNVTAFFYSKSSKAKFKNLGKATWAAK